jgi:hypothetical protein
MDGTIDIVALGKVIEGVGTKILDYALLLAAGGTITMALIELVKALSRGRLHFHRWMVERWVGHDAAVLDDLLSLAIGGSDNASALYDQPTGKMLGQLQAAANLALDFPTVYPAFYDFLTAGAATRDNVNDRATWKDFAQKMTLGVPTDSAAKAAFEQESRGGTQARARLGNLVTRKLDALQTKVEYVWARINQGVALIAGWWFFYYVLSQAAGMEAISQFTQVAISLFAGLIAPFAKDVVSALSGLRVKRT